jgi:hypothetical protein
VKIEKKWSFEELISSGLSEELRENGGHRPPFLMR